MWGKMILDIIKVMSDQAEMKLNLYLFITCQAWRIEKRRSSLRYSKEPSQREKDVLIFH